MRGIETLQAFGQDAGWDRPIQTLTTGQSCMVHDVPLVRHVLEAFNGWHGVLACPDYDGECVHNPDREPEPIDTPDIPKPARPQRPPADGQVLRPLRSGVTMLGPGQSMTIALTADGVGELVDGSAAPLTIEGDPATIMGSLLEAVLGSGDTPADA